MINVVDTPNRDTKKFVFDKTIVAKGSKEFKKKDGSVSLVDELFSTGKIELIYLDKNFISIRKSRDVLWEDLTQKILNLLNENIKENFIPLKFEEENNFTDDVSIRIEEVLSEKIRPAVAMDGGDITFCSFESGVVTLQMKGACAGCPSSTATLKMGIENMLRHYIPEVTEVRAAEL